jgi:hypothetical protein
LDSAREIMYSDNERNLLISYNYILKLLVEALLYIRCNQVKTYNKVDQ